MRTQDKANSSGLADVLFGQSRGGVLALLYGNPEKTFYIRQIARALKASPGAIAPELNLLARIGLLVSSRTGNHVFYQANRHSPVFKEVKALVEKTVGLSPLLRSALDPIADHVRLAFIYGSVAKGEERADSDVDLMVVGQVEANEVLARVSALEKQLGREVNPTVFSVAEFSAKLASGSHFVTSVARGPKTFLIGDEDELGRLGRVETHSRRAE